MNDESAACLFDVMSSAPRLRVLRLLVSAGGAGVSAGDLAASLGMTPSALSFHLSLMTEKNLITQEKRSRQRIYRVSFETLGDILNYLLEDCCQNDPQIQSCCPPIKG